MIGKLVMPIALLAVGLLLGGCPGHIPATTGGECRVFINPGFAVQGKRLRDKQWIGMTQEAGISVCGWGRPKQ